MSASPGGGLYYRKRIGGPGSGPPPPSTLTSVSSSTQIASEDVTRMIDHAAILERINNNEARGRWLLWIGYPLAFLLLCGLSGVGLLIGVVVVVLCHLIKSYLPSRSPVQLDYQMDEEEERKWQALQRSFDALARCQRLWQVNAFENTSDWKRNAGASQVVNRLPAIVGNGTARSFIANLQVFHLRVQGETLYFLPDMILIQQKGRFGSISYSNLESTYSITQFREEQGVPSDSPVISTTWRFVNKKGGPDLRFNNNRQIPVVRYGEIALRSQSGLRLALLTSCAGAAETFVAGIHFVQSFKPVQIFYLPSTAE